MRDRSVFDSQRAPKASNVVIAILLCFNFSILADGTSILVLIACEIVQTSSPTSSKITHLAPTE